MTRRYRRIFDLRVGGRRRIDAEMDAEIESHVAMRVADLVRAGMSPDDARREAMRRFGDFDAAQRQLRAGARQREASMSHRDWLKSVGADIAYALRQFRNAPVFTAVAVATLALGVGATTSIFTLVDRVLLRPLPFPRSEQLVHFDGVDSTGAAIGVVSQPDWMDWSRAPSLAASTIYRFPTRQTIVTDDSSARATSIVVTGDFFGVFRPRFVAGRPFTREELDAPTPAVVISERLWRTVFGADPRLAAPLRTPARSLTIVGVVADGQEFPANTDIWIPIPRSQLIDAPRVNVNWLGVARLRADATRERAAFEMSTIARGIYAGDPTALYDHGVAVRDLAEWLVGPIAEYLRKLMGAVLLVLLIVCANVAASALARSTSRTREMAIRTSLGAMRGRLIQQMLIEHLTLGLAGGLLGLFAAWAVVRVIVTRWGAQIPRAGEIALDWRILAVAIGSSLLAGAAAGVLPAWRATGAPPRALLAAGGRTAARGGHQLAGAWLVITEIALALLLVIGSALLIRSFRAVLSRDIGFDTQVATVEAAVNGPRFATDTMRRYIYWDALVDGLRAIPGVKAVGLSQWIPLGLTGQGFIDLRDRDVPGASAVYRVISEDFFSALRIPLVAGRVFDRSDALNTPRVGIVNQTMARKYWPGESALGKQVRVPSMERGAHGTPPDWITVVGVVGDVRTYGLETDPRPELYTDFRQVPSFTYGMTALVRGSASPARLARDVRRVAHDVDAHVPVDVGTLEQLLARTLGARSLTMSLLSAFAGAALLLAALGIYGVLSYSVAQRTRELAVRAALGAQRQELLRLVLRSGLRVVATGIAIGIGAAALLTRTLDAMLFGVSHNDVWSYAGAIAVIFVVGLAAILIPARRATRLDPMIALQAE